MAEEKKWCEHIKFTPNAYITYEGYEPYELNFFLEDPKWKGRSHWVFPSWNFCPICGAPRPKEEK